MESFITGHVACIGRGEMGTGFCRENLKERDHWEDLDIGRRIILKWTFQKYDGVVWTGLIWLRTETS
jgi:hypothetical protein